MSPDSCLYIGVPNIITFLITLGLNCSRKWWKRTLIALILLTQRVSSHILILCMFKVYLRAPVPFSETFSDQQLLECLNTSPTSSVDVNDDFLFYWKRVICPYFYAFFEIRKCVILKLRLIYLLWTNPYAITIMSTWKQS